MGNLCAGSERVLGPTGPESFAVMVKGDDGRVVKVRVEPQEEFGVIKDRIGAALGQPESTHKGTTRLARNFNGIALNLDNTSTVASVGLKPDEILTYQTLDSSVPGLKDLASNENSILALGKEDSIQKYF
mmetsp:Transcript_7211/g.19318  ORF Transcript_7211/g.19318 Transcript_7211/m.19318 type:complete len:130 (-) Transcript_7211:696-1085(-)